MLKQSIRVSRFARPLTIELEKPIYFLQQSLTGRTIRVSKETLRFFRLAKKRSPLSPTYLKQQLHPSSFSVLELLLKEGIFVGRKEAPLWKQFPVCKGAISFLNPDGQREILIPEWTGHPTKFSSFFPDKISWEILVESKGNLSLAQIFQNCVKRGIVKTKDRSRFLKIVETLISPKNQLLKFSPKKLSKIPFELHHAPLHSFQHPKEVRGRKKRDSKNNVVQLESFHQNHIHDAFAEFDHVETTVSHAFREPSESLAGLSYGAAFFDGCKRIAPIEKAHSILEVGGGTGIFSKAFLERAEELNFSVNRYQILDLSPALQNSQRRIHKYTKNIEFILGNAETLPLPKERYDWILSNEVVADFTTVKIQKNQLRDFQKSYCQSSYFQRPNVRPIHEGHSEEVVEAMDLISRFRIPFEDAPEEFYFNLGTARFLKQIHRSLKIGGLAVIVEFGGAASYPTATTHLNHDEYSIHWGQMCFFAKQLGFHKVDLVDLTSFVQFNPHTPLVSNDVYCLQEIFRRYKKHLPLLAFDTAHWEKMKSSLPQANIQGIEFSPLYEGRHFGPIPHGFQVLVLRK